MGRMLVVNAREVRELLDLDALIDALAIAMRDLSDGSASVPSRIGAMVPEREAFLAAMPGYVPSLGALAAKLVTLFPHNEALGVPAHQGLIAVFDPATGTPAALLDGTAITAVRTAAGSALSARLLAREDASVLAVLGSGVQAREHARVLPRVRPIREIRVAARDPARGSALAAQLAAELGLTVTAVGSYEEALRGADIACATTAAADPVVRRAWLAPGMHVTSVGYNMAGREIDDATIADALVCVESRAAVLAPAPAGSNDLIEPIRDGVIDEGHIHAELGELVAGTRRGRTSRDQITLYKSVGVAVQDAAAAALVLAAARARNIGREVEI
jgi:ornithine cyclodeaminase/alanine dehydrogenase-like protein (mu-crystallin family)